MELAEARAQFGREPVTLPDPVPAHPLLDGRPEIGRGEYSIVIDKGDGERVYKVVSSPADYCLYTADDRPRSAHFPIVHADHGIIGRSGAGYAFHLLEMERLYPLDERSPASALAARLVESYWRACSELSRLGRDMGRIALFRLTQHPPEIPASLLEALKALSDFVEAYELLPDLLNVDNLMMRKDGTLVLSDPVFIA